jgi:hypothetical protein
MLVARRVAAQTIAIAAVFAARSAWSQEASTLSPQYPPVATHHQGTFNGKRVSYTATVKETIVPNAAGKPGARIVSIAYTADGADPGTRPVLFACNGGPIGPSNPLHMMAIGPKRCRSARSAADPSTFQLVDNTYTVLDVADIVFFDPASTGWSRVVDGSGVEEYYTTDADAQQFTAFIDKWLHENNRMASPKYALARAMSRFALRRRSACAPPRADSSRRRATGQATNRSGQHAPVQHHRAGDRASRSRDRVVPQQSRSERAHRISSHRRLQFANGDYLTRSSRVTRSTMPAVSASPIASSVHGDSGGVFLANNLRITRPASKQNC